MKKPLSATAALLGAFSLLFLVNFAARGVVGSTPLDLTEDRLYTLSEGSKSVLANLSGGLTLEFYYSEGAARKMPQIASFAERVGGLLDRYSLGSGGRVGVVRVDPKPDTDHEEEALKLGLHALENPGREPVYLGIALKGEKGRTEVIPFLNPGREPFLEYDLTKLIASAAGPAKRTVGVASSVDIEGNPGIPMMGVPPSQGWVLAEELRSRFNLRHVTLEEGVPEGLDLLVLIHPKGLTPKALYAVDQYLMRGGPLFVAVDPLALSEGQGGRGGDPSSNLDQLFKAWGVSFVPARIAADGALATGVYLGGAPLRHPAFLTITPANMNPEAVETAGLENLLFAAGGSLDFTGVPEGVEAKWLLRTTDAPSTLDSIMMRDMANPQGAFASLENLDKPLALMARLTGRFASAFRDGPPEGAAAPQGGHLARGERSSAVVVAADVDWLADDFSVQRQRLLGETLILPMNDNLTLAMNVAEGLAGSPELIALRARSRADRPFTRVEELSTEAARRYRGVEEGLLARQEEVNRKLSELSPAKPQGSAPALTEAQAEEVRKFREELAQTKRRLREVRLDLRSGIEELGSEVKFINVLLVPGVVLLAGFLPGLRRLRRRTGGK